MSADGDTKAIGKGTGLGLSVVCDIIAANDGRISVESTPGKGGHFDVIFPAAARRRVAA